MALVIIDTISDLHQGGKPMLRHVLPPSLKYRERLFSSVTQSNCNKFYCNLTFCKLNTYLILTNAYLILWRQNAATNKNI